MRIEQNKTQREERVRCVTSRRASMALRRDEADSIRSSVMVRFFVASPCSELMEFFTYCRQMNGTVGSRCSASYLALYSSFTGNK